MKLSEHVRWCLHIKKNKRQKNNFIFKKKAHYVILSLLFYLSFKKLGRKNIDSFFFFAFVGDECKKAL